MDERVRRLWILTATALSICGWCVGEAPAQSAPNDTVQPGAVDAAIEQTDWRTVIKLLEPTVSPSRSNTSEETLYRLGLAHYHLDHVKPAARYLREALNRNPHSTPTIEMLAEMASRARDDETLAFCAQLAPDNARVLSWRAMRRLRQGDRELERELSPHHADFQSLIHVLPGRSGAKAHYRQADELLRQAIALAPQLSLPRTLLAHTLDRLGNEQGAIEQMVRADLIEPLTSNDYQNLARWWANQGRLEESLQTLEMATKASPKVSVELIGERTTILARMGRFEEAAELYRQIFKHDHNHRSVRSLLGKAAYQDGDYPLAIFAFRESYLTDSNLDSLARLGVCAFDLGQDALAVHYIDKAIKASQAKSGDTFIAPSDWLFARGRANWNLEKRLDAADDLLAAVVNDDGNAEKVRWAVYVCKEIKAPHGLIDAAQAWGLHGDPNEGIEVLKYVRANWFFPVSRDHRGKSIASHQRRSDLALARIVDKQRLYRTAFDSWSSAYFGWSSWSCWLAVRAENLPAAKRGFTKLSQSEDQVDRNHGWVGLAYVAIAQRDAKAATTAAGQIDHESFRWIGESVKAYAEAIDDPQQAGSLSRFDKLGVYGVHFRRSHGRRGLQVEAVLPGSPLHVSTPMIQPRDLILSIDEVPLYDAARIAELRQPHDTAATVNVTVMRDGRVFDIEFDVAAAANGIRQALTKE